MDMNGVVNPYTILGFFPEQSPSLDEIKSRYRFLTQIHHPDAGGMAEIFQPINDAYSWIVSNDNPGPCFFEKNQAKTMSKTGWRTNEKGNWIRHLPDGAYATVFRKEPGWKWACGSEWAKFWFSTAEEAIADFEDCWIRK